jgi:hypothetical protein
MNHRNQADADKRQDWRQYMRDLPNDARPFPIWARWLFLVAPSLVVAGALVVSFGGAMLGMSFGIGQDEPGAGTIWIMFRIFPAFAFGSLIAFIGKLRGWSRAASRSAFYLFTLPAWIFLIFMAWKIVEHFLLG